METYEPAAVQADLEDVPTSARPTIRSRTTSTATNESADPNASDEFLIQFYYGNPNVEMVKGILHLHRENERTPLNPTVPRSSLLCMLSVPAFLSTRDLLSFVAPFSTEIERLKIVRDQTPNQYMVLAKFKTQEAADLFYDHFNGVPFNSIEPGICHLAYVGKTDAVEDIEGGGMSMKGFTELPTCAFCLERMDEGANGVLTILCNHSFHSACLEQWGDTSCPVCRYFQTPQMSEEQTCFQCGMSSDDLWLCLICGHIGCGRYSEKHAVVHFNETQHTYALNVKTQRVWDYVGDGYVHRLIQGHGAEKIVEYQGGNPGNMDEKMESITLEYTYLLTTQLESQRHYFEERMADLRKENEDSNKAMELLKTKSLKEKQALEKKLQLETAKVEKIKKDLENEQLMNFNLRTNQKEYEQLLEKVRKEKEQLLAEKEREIVDLKEQLHDLLLHLETQEKISALPEAVRQDIEGGHVLTHDRGDVQSTAARRTSNRRRNR